MKAEDAAAGGCIGGFILLWIVGVLLSLGLSAAIIYFLIQAAQGKVF